MSWINPRKRAALASMGLLAASIVSCSGSGPSEEVASGRRAGVARGQLTRAILRGESAKAEDLIKAGADVNENLGSGSNQVTPLLVAVVTNKPDMVRLLLRKGANPTPTHEGYTAKDFAHFLEQEQSAAALEEAMAK